MAISDRNARGDPPPREWWSEQGGRASAQQFRAWQDGHSAAQGKRGKFNQAAGYYTDLGLSLKSLLEANALRLLLFLGYQRWTDKQAAPSAGGRWVCYEWRGRTFRLIANEGKRTEKPVIYLPDFHLWDETGYHIWETKGMLDQRSKRIIRLMAEQCPDVPLALITREELDMRKAAALYEARRHGPVILEIPNWHVGPKVKEGVGNAHP